MKQIRFWNFFDRILNSGAAIAAGMVVFAMLAVCVTIASRAISGDSLTWVSDSCAILLLYITFLGAGWVLKMDEHVKIDTLLNRLHPKHQNLLNVITSIIGVMIFAVVSVYGSIATLTAYQEQLWMSTTLQTPKWIILIAIPVGSILLLIQFLRRVHGLIMQRDRLHDRKLKIPKA